MEKQISDSDLAERLHDCIDALASDGMVSAAKVLLGLEVEFNEFTEDYTILREPSYT